MSFFSNEKIVNRVIIILLIVGIILGGAVAYTLIYYYDYFCLGCDPCSSRYYGGTLLNQSSFENSSLEVQITFKAICSDCNIVELVVINSTTTIPANQIWWTGENEVLSNESTSYIIQKDQNGTILISIDGGFKHGETYEFSFEYITNGGLSAVYRFLNRVYQTSTFSFVIEIS